jgi:DNA replication and repair protein RecF
MYLEKISLLNFKNYEELALTFSSQVNFFTGSNGSGKTNLLDAIYYLSFSKSALNSTDSQNIKHGSDFFMIQGNYMRKGKKDQVQCNFSLGQKKVLQLNKTNYDKFSEHIGQFPSVLISPYDTDLIREGSEERRKFFDAILSQIDHLYLNEIIKYNQILKQRNSLLKQFNEKNYVDKDLLDSYDIPLLKSGNYIYNRRKAFLAGFIPVFLTHYQNLSEKKETVTLAYFSQLEAESFEKDFMNSIKKDIAVQRTTRGVHRDDFIFKIGDHPLKSLGSQGQQKSFVIALKLAQFDIIKKDKGVKPLLLLDDIFDKLDDKRINKLMQMVADHSFGQLFITDARIERSQKFFSQLNSKISIFKIEKGNVTADLN